MFYGYTVNKFSAWICINHKNPIFWLFCGSLVDTRWDWILKFAVQHQITLKTNKNLIFLSNQSSNKMTRILILENVSGFFHEVLLSKSESAQFFWFIYSSQPKDFFNTTLDSQKGGGSKTVFPPLNSFNN